MATSPGKDGLTAIISRSKMSNYLKVGPQRGERHTSFCGLWNSFCLFFFFKRNSSFSCTPLAEGVCIKMKLYTVSSGTGTGSHKRQLHVHKITRGIPNRWRISWHRARSLASRLDGVPWRAVVNVNAFRLGALVWWLQLLRKSHPPPKPHE